MHREIASTTGEIRKGKLLVRGWQRLDAAVKRQRDCQVFVRIERLQATRTLSQNAWYWSQVVGLVADYTGYTSEQVHKIYKKEFLPEKLAIANSSGEIVDEFVIGGTTTILSTEEFSEYCESIRIWAAEKLGVVIPDPQ